MLISISLLGCASNKFIELPITKKEGYGPFNFTFIGISIHPVNNENNPWQKTYLPLSALPHNLTDIKLGDINTDRYQSVYQNYHQGNISKEMYGHLQNSWDWEPDSLTLSRKPIKCKIAFAIGKDADGKIKMVVDANNNLDLSDDMIFTPMDIDSAWAYVNRDSLALANAITVTYERLSRDRVVKDNAPLFIVYDSAYDMYMCNFPQYLSTQLHGVEVAVSSNGFTDISYYEPSITVINDSLQLKGLPLHIISKNGYMELNGTIYKSLDINRNKNILVFEKINLQKNQLYSTQEGYKAIPFYGEDFITKASISLDDFKGKYILLDFWATWCGPCIQEFPHLKAMYENLDKSRFDIIGIVGDSSSKDLNRMMEEHGIAWPQILSDNTNKITEKYFINAYPTTLLLNPEGVIIAKNLRGKKLEDKIFSLTK